jgi:hypothetical protein
MIGYLIDMDGVIYRGGQLIPGADRFVNGLRQANMPFRDARSRAGDDHGRCEARRDESRPQLPHP